jgi:hypothetical protein
MTQADRVLSTPRLNTPVDPTRRRFLSQAAGVAAGGTVLALATVPPAPAASAQASPQDPVFGLIEVHRRARVWYLASLDEQNRLERLDDPAAELVAEGPCNAEFEALDILINTPAVTFAGLLAWASYLDEIRRTEEWMFTDNPFAPALIATFAEALGNLAVTS